MGVSDFLYEARFDGVQTGLQADRINVRIQKSFYAGVKAIEFFLGKGANLGDWWAVVHSFTMTKNRDQQVVVLS